MRLSKQAVVARLHKIPTLRFEDQRLTSFAGVVVLQALFQHLEMASRLKSCFRHLTTTGAYGAWRIVLLLIVHLLLGFRRLRDVDYYRDDPLVQRLLGLRRLPDVATVSRTLKQIDGRSVAAMRQLVGDLVLAGLQREQFPRLTADFDGSVLSTKAHAEGTAVGFNPRHKGQRSYYPLFCTIAQTGQFLDMHHRPGCSHDSNGAHDFMMSCFDQLRDACPTAHLEARLDSAFFDHKIFNLLDLYGVEATISVPFERLPALKAMMEARRRWHRLDDQWSFFESDWKPKAWPANYRFLFVRHRVRRQQKGPLQLDLFEPRAFDYDYRVIATNKGESPGTVLQFHHGRGSQEGLFGEAKQHSGLDLIPTRRQAANQVVTLSAMMAHNLGRELQMLAAPRDLRAKAKRPAAWRFLTLDTLRHRFLQRAGRLTEPQGELTLTLSANPKVQTDLLHFLDALRAAA